ncbi:amidase [Dyadobacter sp. NIV53]|uniref:amidase n=1 Tax=Dyadobacter sp. NIV53 TaxID=2861765 RepID=UPI001C86E6E3|nr:amidase [Dyadobacter sp. NIV53]
MISNELEKETQPSRREFLSKAGKGGVAAIALAGLMSSSPGIISSKSLSHAKLRPVKLPEDPLFTSAKNLASMIQSKKISSVELTEMYFKRIELVNPQINAVVMLCKERALMEAKMADDMLAKGKSKGPLHGVPVTIKDSIDTAGVVSTGGTMGRKNFIPGEDATVVARLRNAGAIVMGKTNTPEFTLAGTTANLIYGMTSNPYKAGYTPGGSSGGAGSIIASGGSPMDIGSDFGGSIRMPAHYNGIAGLKPTTGRVPRTGHIVDYGGIFDTYQVLGPLARWVEDLAYILPIISGPDQIDAAIHPVPLEDPSKVDLKKLKYAWHIDIGSAEKCTPETIKAVQGVADMLKDGKFVITNDAPVKIIQEAEKVRSELGMADGRAWVRRLVERSGTKTTHPLLGLSPGPAGVASAARFTELVENLDASRSKMLQWLESYDIVISPVMASPAKPNPDNFDPKPRDPASYGFVGIYNMTGWPSAVVRAGVSPEGLPIGVQIIGRPWQEHVVLAVASFIESQTGGWQPPLALNEIITGGK